MSMQGEEATPDGGPPPRRWLRAAGLFGLTMMTVVFAPSVLIGVPFILLAVFLPGPRAAAWIVAAVFLLFAMMPTESDGIWYLERGWALLVGGWFAAVTWVWPQVRFSSRGLLAIGGATIVVAGYFALNPATWEFADWLIRTKVGGDVAALGEGLRVLTDIDQAFVVTTFERLTRTQVRLYPALVGLSTFAALGVAWWLYIRLSHGRSDGLGPLRDFGFPDGMVWIVIGAIALVLGGTAGATLVGYNTLL
ncbi:MAG: hypothetical protein ACR2QM_15900, partial [Longimicrobiales bacterium]